MNPDDYITADISAEEWREVDLGNRSYRIYNPVTLIYRRGGATHRVVDATGVVHCYPAPETGLSILRWMPRDPKAPVQF